MKFWNWVKNEETGQRDLYLEGIIAQESWWGDEVTPAAFKEELNAGNGAINIHINSVGGDCIAASMIYTMLMDYPGEVTVQIDGLAASAASVVAMAGTTVRMSPTALMLIHNPWTSASGDASDMQKAIALLDEVKESIINAYAIKTGLDRATLAELMDQETWMNAYRARELGFCDEVLFDGSAKEKVSFEFSNRTSAMQALSLVKAALPAEAPEGNRRNSAPIELAIEPASEPEPVSASEPEPIPTPESEPTREPAPLPAPRVSVRGADDKLEHLRF